MRKIFGTDGIRGVANQYPMTAEVALSVGRALAHAFANGHKPRVLIGKDTRLSGYMIEMAIASGICSMGADVLLIGPMATPGIAFLTQAMRADAGVVISASHNGFQDNGIKIFDRNGFKLSDEKEIEIERLMNSDKLEGYRPTAEKIGKAFRVEDAGGRYIEFLKSTFPKDLTLEGIKIVIDCAHGATYHTAPMVFRELGAEVTVLGDKPDGRNINDGLGAVHPQAMAQEVLRVKANAGIALDGDGDRVVFADEKGQIIDGDAILAICAEELLKKGLLKKNTAVVTVMSNRSLENYLQVSGGKTVRTPVGDRYVVEKMREGGFNFGGEPSGHVVFLDHATTGDGLIAALQVFAIMQQRRQRLSEIVAGYRALPQILTSVKVAEKKDLEKVAEVQQMIQGFEKDLGNQGRVLVRYSGTEPLIRIMVEGPVASVIDKMAKDLSNCVRKNLS